MKTVQRFFTVSGVLVTVFVLMVALTPLSSAIDINNRTPYDLPIDTNFQYVFKYFYGSNSGIIDYRDNGTNRWYRIIVDNTNCNCTLVKSSGSFTLQISVSNTYIYRYNIGTTYSSTYRFASTHWEEISSGTLYLALTNLPYVNCCGVPIRFSNVATNEVVHCDFNSYYPFSASSGDRFVSTVVDNQASIASSQDQADNSRYSAEQSADNSRQSEIINAGSDVTVSTIDNWVGGNNGLAGKLTELAATLSSNADIFSQNQSQNQANLSKAGEFVGNVFNQIPTGITAAAVCFLIILIAVKVVGR